MGLLGTFLKLSPEQEKKFLENVRKFAEEMDPDSIKKEIAGYASKVDNLHETSLINNEILNTLAIYFRNNDPEAWSAASKKAKELRSRIEQDRARRIWKG